MYVFGSPYKSGCTKHGCIRGLYKSGFVLGTSIICIVVYLVKSGFAVMLITRTVDFRSIPGLLRLLAPYIHPVSSLQVGPPSTGSMHIVHIQP